MFRANQNSQRQTELKFYSNSLLTKHPGGEGTKMLERNHRIKIFRSVVLPIIVFKAAKPAEKSQKSLNL